MTPGTRRTGDDLTRCFQPVYMGQAAIEVSLGECVAEAYVALVSCVGPDDETLRELLVRADDALSAVLEHIWKRRPAEEPARS